MNRKKLVAEALLAFASCTLACGAALADAWPAKPVRIIASTPPGGSIDYVARLLAQKLPATLGQSVIVENKAGAAGNIATEYVARAPADGHTLLVVASSHATNVSLYAKLGFDPIRDFAPISELTSNFFVVAVPAASPASNMSELVALAKSKKGGLAYASAGSGQGNHLGMELLKTMGHFEAVHVPFNGVGPATTALLGSQVDVALLTLPGAMPHVKSGRLKVLAMTAAQRSPLLPGVPTVAESGFPGYELLGWVGLLAPAGTPKEVVDRLWRESARILKEADVLKQLEVVGAEPVATAPQEFTRFLQDETAKWGKIIRQSGAKAE